MDSEAVSSSTESSLYQLTASLLAPLVVQHVRGHDVTQRDVIVLSDGACSMYKGCKLLALPRNTTCP